MAGASLEYRVAFKAIHDILIQEWDPIGVGDDPNAHDEFDSYIPPIYRMLKEGVADETLARHLAHIESDRLGLSRRPERNLEIAKRLRESVDPGLFQ